MIFASLIPQVIGPEWLSALGALFLLVPLGFIGAIAGLLSKVPIDVWTSVGSIVTGGLFGNKDKGTLRDDIAANRQNFDAFINFALNDLGIPVTQDAIQFLEEFILNDGLSPRSQQFLTTLETRFPEIRNEITDFARGFDSVPAEIRQQFQQSTDIVNQAVDRNTDILARPGGLTPQQTGAFDQLLQIGQGQTDLQNASRDSILDILNNRGSTEQSRFLFESAQDARNRVNDPRFDANLNLAGSIVGNFGFTPQSSELFGEELDIIRSGGQTADSQRLIGVTQGIIDAGGMTPEIRNALGQVESELRSGGLSPQGQAILDEMTQIVQARGRGGALLGFDEALTRSGNLAARDALAGREAGIAQARQRAAPGAVIGSGLVGQDMGRVLAEEFTARTAAMDRAALNQQGLQLQQLQGAGAVGAELERAGTQRLGILQGARGDLLRAAAANLSSAIQGNVGAQGIETNRLIGAISGANQTNNAAVAQFGQAVNLMNTTLDHQLGLLNLSANAAQASGVLQNSLLLGGLGASQAATGLRLSGAAGAGQLATAGAGQQQQAIAGLLGAGSLNNQNVQNMLTGRGQNINLGLGLGGLELQNFGMMANMLNQGNANTLSAILGLGNIGTQGLQLALGGMNGLNNQSAILSGMSQQGGFFNSLLNQGLETFGNVINRGGLGGLFGGGGGGGVIGGPRSGTGPDSGIHIGGDPNAGVFGSGISQDSQSFLIPRPIFNPAQQAANRANSPLFNPNGTLNTGAAPLFTASGTVNPGAFQFGNTGIVPNIIG